MECGESLGLYAVVNRQTRECSRPLSVRKEQWNGTPFYPVSYTHLKQFIRELNAGDFPITSVHRDDLEGKGFDVKKISDNDMQNLAKKMCIRDRRHTALQRGQTVQ